ncbi:hypothetical protein C0Q70_18943 [Pomacea canaliculata]|uniref:Alpha-carbonic anhydrase domain-containing protein n=1 Tax=Pomacea canaliculata TaxID=400727 RepID=A0A2T7NI11_POMCA|nr:hypothetical protein C0Q70_18943 [Pomacea canaliculata]
MSGGPLPRGMEYELAEMRFHWGRENGRGSEHTVNSKAFSYGAWARTPRAEADNRQPGGCTVQDPMLRDYWTYEGSLTTPPCSENVTWILMRYPLMVSYQQMEEFRRLKTHNRGEQPRPGDDGTMADNFRPTQPLNGRVVRASFQY